MKAHPKPSIFNTQMSVPKGTATLGVCLLFAAALAMVVGTVRAQVGQMNTDPTAEAIRKQVNRTVKASEPYMNMAGQVNSNNTANNAGNAQQSNAQPQAIQAPPVEEKPFWKSLRDGWFWYKDPKEEPPAKPDKPPVSKNIPQPKPQKPKTDLELFSEFQAKLEDARKIAIISPTLENVKNYRLIEQAAFDQSMVFAKQIEIVNSAERELNMFATGSYPADPIGASIFSEKRDTDKKTLVHSLAATHGLFFFFRSDCPYCHAFAPILSRFERDSKIKVIPVSMDGPGLPQYPSPQVDNGIFKRFNIHTVPALVVAHPEKNKYRVINFGVIPTDEIYNKIYNFAVDKVDNPDVPMKRVLGTIVVSNK